MGTSMILASLRDEQGLTVLELLVALVITSLLTMALGWSLSAAVDVQRAAERSDKIDLALIRLAGLSANLRQSMVETAVVGDGGEINIMYKEQLWPSFGVALQIATGPMGTVRTLRATGAAFPEASVSLATFDASTFEVFVEEAEHGEWRTIDEVPAKTPIFGIRLRLAAMARTWFPVLWSHGDAIRGEP
jgi:Tfp pilus assembly protein FimT